MRVALLLAALVTSGAALAAPVRQDAFLPMRDNATLTMPCTMSVDGQKVNVGPCSIDTGGPTGSSVYTQNNGCVVTFTRDAGRLKMDLTSYKDICVPAAANPKTATAFTDVSATFAAIMPGNCYVASRIKVCFPTLTR